MQSKFDMYVKRRVQARLFCAIGSIITVVLFMSLMFPDMNVVISFFVSLVASFVLTHFTTAIAHLAIHLIYYGSDMEELTEDALNASKEQEPQPEPTVEKVHFKVVNTPDKAYARYMDADIFEWIDVEDDKGVVHRCTFTGTLDMKKGPPEYIPPGHLLLWPGILYQVDTPV